MIPKIIHYCWFGGAPKPALISNCIASWKKCMPDYEIKEWNETNFDFNQAPFCQEAYNAKKWAFVADYCRIYALSSEGGIYMDTDIMVLKPFDEFLKYSFFSSQEFQPKVFDATQQAKLDHSGNLLPNYKNQFIEGIGIQSGVMMAEKGCKFIQDCLKYYQQLHLPENLNDVIVVKILSKLLEPYGYRYTTQDQLLQLYNIRISEAAIFSNMTALNPESYAWHMYYRSWGNGFSLKQTIRNNFPRFYVLLQLIAHNKYSWTLIKKLCL